jgi:hypothetical protein
MRRLFWLVFTIAIAAGLISPLAAPAAAQSGQRCFAETGYCIGGPIRAYWEHNGGLPVFGYPIAEQRVETVEGRTLQVQWFERDRLEIQADGTITAGRLGARYLELTGRPWQQFGAEQPVNSLECSYFEQTRFNVCGWFLGYWQRNGGLERFGYPISPVFEEQIEGRTYSVQYFERRRMEYHPENSFPYDVLLGLLGRDVLALEQRATIPDCAATISPALRAAYTRVQLGRPVGCPVLVPGNDVAAAVQSMERGQMIWYGRAAGPPMVVLNPRIFAVISSASGLTFRTYDDTWVEGDPDVPAGSPPRPGLYAPWRGFGKAWSQDPTLREQIGWATEPQARAERADYQLFDSGILLVYLRGSGATYAFGNPSNPSEVQVIR